jgi:8-oxo-dGTP diphosphatase
VNDRTKAEGSGGLAIKVTAAIIERGGKVLIARRKKGDRFEGKWEFPGGKIEAGESPKECLRRELREELGVEVEAGEFLCSVSFETSGLSIELMAFRTSLLAGEVRCHDHDEIRWIEPEQLGDFDLAEPDRRVAATVFPSGRRDEGTRGCVS